MQISREKQIELDRYYMGIAKAVEAGANCLGTKVGAIIVVQKRVLSTGYNGTPAGFPNCMDHGCVRCHDSWLFKQGRQAEMSDQRHVAGAALDRCVCVHAEQNAYLAAAKFGIALNGATLYTTQSPCFNCLKESVQVGVERIVYDAWYRAEYSKDIAEQYVALYTHLAKGGTTNFEALGGGRPKLEREGQPDAYAVKGGTLLDPPEPTLN